MNIWQQPLPMTAYDKGYDTVCGMKWGRSECRLQMVWLLAQLEINPKDDYRRGRYDAFCDIMARKGVVPRLDLK
jgi:hypothetical protein